LSAEAANNGSIIYLRHLGIPKMASNNKICAWDVKNSAQK
jgi:hypothetical protein